MSSVTDLSTLPAYDPNSLNGLKRLGKDNSPEAIHGAAQQLESVFLGMVLKSMRDATPQDGMFDSDQTRSFQSMMDQQLAQTLAARGQIGLAAMLEKQLLPKTALPASDGSTANSAVGSSGGNPQAASRMDRTTLRNAALHVLGAAPQAAKTSAAAPAGKSGEFVDKLWPHAMEAAKTTGIPAHFMIGHAALETGWGKAEILNGDGSTSHNLFGIKAGKNWTGATVDTLTTEFVGGVAQKRVERFRAYGSYAEAFTDYANLLKNRYGNVVGSQDAKEFAQGLQKAGYATDPMYGAKLERIISGKTLRTRLMG